MNKLPAAGLLSLFCLFASSQFALAAGQRRDLASADWTVNGPHNLAKNPPSKDDVWTLMNHFWGGDPLETGSGKLCSFRFADLRRCGQLSLVVTYDGGGRADCNYVEVFDKHPNGLEAYDFMDGVQGSMVDDIVMDINGDGRLELAVDTHLAAEGVLHPPTCYAEWPRVYAWTGNGYTEVSSQYPKYYERELKSLKKQIAALDAAAAHSGTPASDTVSPAPHQETPPSAFEAEGHMEGYWSSGSEAPPQVTLQFPPQEQASQEEAPQASQSASQATEAAPDPDDADCIRAEAAKMERFLGHSRDAGMPDAIRWANSTDPGQRKFAAQILRDIATAQALEYERTLSRDPEPEVAETAKAQLKFWGQKEPDPPRFLRETPYQ